MNWLRNLWHRLIVWVDSRADGWPETLAERRARPDYPRTRAEANDVLANWPCCGWTEDQLIAAHQLTRTPPT